MRAPQSQEEAFSDTKENEQTFAYEAQEDSDPLLETADSEEQKKPPAESRILPASPSEQQTSEDNPSKGMLRKKDVTEEDMVTYREEKSSPSEPIERKSIEEFPAESSDEGASESRLKATHPILRDYAGELELAQRQQAEGNCEASIKTNETLLNSTPPPPQSLQAASFRSLAECYEQTGDMPSAIDSYKNLAKVDPAQSEFVNEKLEEIKIDAAYMNFEGSDTDTEPAN